MKVPYHQLTNNQTKLWLLGGDVRAQMARGIAELYRSGCGIVAWRGQHIAYVRPNGTVQELTPPFHRIEREHIANKPETTACACAEFYDPEVQGPWKLRGTADHHPYCQFAAGCALTYKRMAEKTTQAGGTDAMRPDEHLREQERVLGLRGEKTGARNG